MTTSAAVSAPAPTHTATLKGETIQFHSDDYETAVAAFVARKGGGVPKIDEIVTTMRDAVVHAVTIENNDTGKMEVRPAQMMTTNKAIVAAGEMNHEGRERSETDRKAALANGFSPKDTVYARGSQVNEIGVENARLSREAWAKRPAIRAAALDFSRKIVNEKRVDYTVSPKNVVMASNGRVRPNGIDDPKCFDITEHGFKGLVNRLGLSGGASYLSSCWPMLRATNVNNWTKRYSEIEKAKENCSKEMRDAADEVLPSDFKIRTRVNERSGKREIFAAVGPKYGACDVDTVVGILADNVDASARAEVIYDGRRVKATAIFHSQVQPEHFVAGEFFQAGVIVRSADDGSSSIKISAVLFQNLCLNLIIIDEQELEIGRVIHVGDTEKIAERVKAAVKIAREKIAHFINKWDDAVEHDLLAELRAADKERCEKAKEAYIPVPVSVAFRGLMNGLIEKQLVPISKRDRKATLDRLEVMWNEDESAAGYGAAHTVTRAGVVNALTRYAHASGELDAFEGYDLEKAASKLLSTSAVPFVEEVSAG